MSILVKKSQQAVNVLTTDRTPLRTSAKGAHLNLYDIIHLVTKSQNVNVIFMKDLCGWLALIKGIPASHRA